MKWEMSADNRKGFTIVEVVIVLAITGLIFVGAVVGIGSGLARQRYNDATQDVAQKLRTQYDSISRVQIPTRDDSYCNYVFNTDGSFSSETLRGRTDCSVYGVAVILGANDGRTIQSTTLLGKDLPAYRDYLKSAQSSLHTISDVDAYLANMTTTQLMGELGISNYYGDLQTVGAGGSSTTAITNCKVTSLLTHENLLWESKLENPDGSPAQYIILIIRSPRDGTIHTYVRDLKGELAGDNGVMDYSTYDLSSCHFTNPVEDIRDTLVTSPEKYEVKDLHLCVASDDVGNATGVRRTIHIAADGHGSSAVELVDLEEDYTQPETDNLCAYCDDNPGVEGCK